MPKNGQNPPYESFLESRGFRPEIQGLRAFAVLLVVVYHVWVGKVSGGVDVFLFISTFLLSLSFMRKINEGKPLNLLNYWTHVFTRLLPAASVVILLTLAGSLLVLSPTAWSARAVDAQSFPGEQGGGSVTRRSSIGTMHESAQTASDRSLYLVVSRSGETLTNPDGTVHYVRVLPRTLAEEGAVLGRTVLRPNPVLEPDLIPGFNAREGARDEHAPATAAPAAGTPTAEVRALYCEDDALQAVAAELNAAEPNSQEGPVQASSSGFRYYPVHRDPLGRARYAAALARRDYLIEMRYSAYTGEEAPIGRKGIRRTASGEMVFPRIEPAVMGLVMSRDGERVLLANNRQWHPNRFALIAGFVDPGENLEEAIAREVYEETGLRAERSEYRMSDVWPFPRSLMICYRVTVDENEPIVHHDGEIRAARWFTAEQLREAIAISEERGNSGQDDPAKLELPGTNAVARRMLDDWLAEKP